MIKAEVMLGTRDKNGTNVNNTVLLRSLQIPVTASTTMKKATV
jgi:hypothetical protein